jgi:hypothetical protein
VDLRIARPANFRSAATLLGQVKVWILSSARRRLCLGGAFCVALALLAALANQMRVSGAPSSARSGGVEIAGAAAQAGVDLPDTSIVQAGVTEDKVQSLTLRAVLLAELTSTPPVVTQIAEQAGVPQSELSISTSFVQNIPEQLLGPDLEVRANQIIDSRAPFQINIQPDPNIPRFEIYAQAPTLAQAAHLADSVVPGVRAYLRSYALSHGADPANQVRVQQLGPALGTVLNSSARFEIFGLTFLIVFGFSAALLLLLVRIRRGWTLASTTNSAPHVAFDVPTDRRQGPPEQPDNWPHTTRALPWLIAGFMAILWLVPFDSIQLGGSLPIDLKLDRIVLPVIVLLWVLALAAGGRAAPRVRLSWIHAGIFLFAGLAWLSTVINIGEINHELLLGQAVKRLALLIAYVTFFVMIASVVRRSELAAFLRYTLVLAVVAAIGTIVEFRFNVNVFYDVAHAVLPGFQIANPVAGVDNLGRRLVSGPAELPLEAVGMFTMALPIALIGVIDATRSRGRILYGLAAALLLAAALTTERKSGALGPLAVILTLAFFKRQKLLRLAPLGLVLLVSIKFLAPGAINNVLTQLAPSQLGVSTVDDRVLRFDAIRPDVWLHPLFGQGFGVYSIRILDNELLQRLLEGGLLGLAAYVLMLLIIAFVATALVRSRERDCATVALVAAAAAVSVLVMSALYDWMAYPHDPYILLSLAGLLAVAVKSRREEPFTVEQWAAGQPPGMRSSSASGRHRASDKALSEEYAWSS